MTAVSDDKEAPHCARSHAERMSNANARVEKMFWIPGLGDPAPSDFEEFVEDDLTDAKEILAVFPWLAKLEEIDEVLSELAMRRVGGFFVQLATPVPLSSVDGNGAYSFTWGSYRTRWVHVASVDDIPEKAEAFFRDVVGDARTRAKQCADKRR